MHGRHRPRSLPDGQEFREPIYVVAEDPHSGEDDMDRTEEQVGWAAIAGDWPGITREKEDWNRPAPTLSAGTVNEESPWRQIR